MEAPTMLAESGETTAGLTSSLERSRQSIYNVRQKRADAEHTALIATAEHVGYEVVLEKNDRETTYQAQFHQSIPLMKAPPT